MAYNDGRDDLPDTYWHEVYVNAGFLEELPGDILAMYREAFDIAYTAHPDTWETFTARIERARWPDGEDARREYAAGTLALIRELETLQRQRQRR